MKNVHRTTCFLTDVVVARLNCALTRSHYRTGVVAPACARLHSPLGESVVFPDTSGGEVHFALDDGHTIESAASELRACLGRSVRPLDVFDSDWWFVRRSALPNHFAFVAHGPDGETVAATVCEVERDSDVLLASFFDHHDSRFAEEAIDRFGYDAVMRDVDDVLLADDFFIVGGIWVC